MVSPHIFKDYFDIHRLSLKYHWLACTCSSSRKSSSMIRSMIATGDLCLLAPKFCILLVCCLVRAQDNVANQGAKSARLEMLLTVSRGSPATIGRGGTLRPSLTSNSRDILAICGTKSACGGPLPLTPALWLPTSSPSLTKAHRYI